MFALATRWAMFVLATLGFAVLGGVAGTVLGIAFVGLFGGPSCCGLEAVGPPVVGGAAGLTAGALAPIVAKGLRPRFGEDMTVFGVALVVVPVFVVVMRVVRAVMGPLDSLPWGILAGIPIGVSTGFAATAWRRWPPHAGTLPLLLIAGIALAVGIGCRHCEGPVEAGDFMYLSVVREDELEVVTFLYLAVVVPLTLWAPVRHLRLRTR